MIINGTIQRKIYPQELINWDASFVPKNNDGYLNFIFSGDGGAEMLFSLSKGQILSPDNQLIGGYFSTENLHFSGNINSGKIDLYQDGSPLYLGKHRTTQGDIYNIILQSSENSRFDFQNLTMRGDIPQMQVPTNPFLVLYPNEAVPFTITNSGAYDFVILSGSTSNYNFTVSGAQNLTVPANGYATFYLVSTSSGVTASYQTVPLQLYTDHGTQSFTPLISGAPVINKQYSLYLNIPNTYIKTSSPQTYNLNVVNTDGAQIGIGINYISGITGKYYLPTPSSGKVYNAAISGYVTGSGYLYGYNTGIISGYNNSISGYEYGTGSGIVSGFYTVADGFISGNYRVTGRGLGSTILYGNTLGTGVIDTGRYSGFISLKGGYVTGLITGDVSGSGVLNGYTVSGVLTNPSSLIYLPFTGILTGKFNSDEYYLQNLVSDTIYVTGDFSKNIDLVGYGFATGETRTGIFQGDFGYGFDPGLYTFYTSGNPSGLLIRSTSFTGFDPVKYKNPSGIPLTGLFISNNVPAQVSIDTCYVDLDSITIFQTGYVSRFYRSGTNIPHTGSDFFQLIPTNNYEFQFENSDVKLTGIVDYSKYSNFTGSGMAFNGSGILLNLAKSGYGYKIPDKRTQISREGATASGTGSFNNLFQVAFFDPNRNSGQQYPNYDPKKFIGWNETLSAVTSTLQYTGNTPILSYISGDFDLSEIQIGQNGVTGKDFAQINLSISGNGSYPLSLNLKSSEQRSILYVDIYRKPFSSGVTGFITGNVTGITGYRFISTDTLVGHSMGAYFYVTPCGDVCGETGLGINYVYNTGDYSILISGEQIDPVIQDSYYSLSANSYLGLKQNGYFSFDIIRSGYLDFPLSGLARVTINSSYLPFGIDSTVPILWDVNFAPGESIKSYGFDLYPDAALQQDWGGTIYFELYPTGCYCGDLFIVPNLIANGSINSASFKIRDTEQYAVAHQSFIATLSTGCADNCNIIIPVSITSYYISNGDLYVAGYATPNAGVTVTLSNEQLQTVTSDNRGYWRIIFAATPNGYASVTMTATSVETTATVTSPPVLSSRTPILPNKP